MFDPVPPDFESWLAGELRRPAPPDPARTARVMARVRRAAASPERRQSRWAPPALGLAVAAGLVSLAALHPLALAARPGAVVGVAGMSGAPLGDTLAAAIGSVLRDTMRDTIQGAVDAAVRDTTRLVCVAPRRHRYAVADTQWLVHPAPGREAGRPRPVHAVPDTTN